MRGHKWSAITRLCESVCLKTEKERVKQSKRALGPIKIEKLTPLTLTRVLQSGTAKMRQKGHLLPALPVNQAFKVFA